MAAETFVLVSLGLSALALLANILLWVPILGKGLFLVGKILRIFGFAVGIIDVWAILAWFEVVSAPI